MKTDALLASWDNKSTNVRTLISARRLDLRHAAIGALGTVAPRSTARWAAQKFLSPPPPRPLSPKAQALLDRAADRFAVKLETDFGGEHDTSKVSVSLWGRGPAVYLLHGWGGRGSQWISFVEPLVEAGFTAVAIDAPAHGESPAPRTSILHFAGALEAVIDSVGPARSVVGHSFGGAAASLARKRGVATESVVLIGSPADPAEFFDVFMGRLGIPARIHPLIKANIERSYGFRWSELAVTGRGGVEEAPEVPALVVHDRNDAEVAYTDAVRITRAWPDSQLLTTEGLGHQRILRDRDVVRRVVTWLSNPSAGGAPEGRSPNTAAP